MITPQDEPFLRRAMRLAMNGRGYTEPNPSVGCVLVKNGQIVGEGWTQPFSGPHAEPTALADCKAKGNDPAGATAYVTLEPCCHENKKTPPCAPRLIEAKVTRVVIGCLDPNPYVNGKGVAMLRAAGIEVEIIPGAKSYSLVPACPELAERVPGGEGGGERESARGRQLSLASQATTPSPQFSHPGPREKKSDGSHFQQLIAPFILRQQGRRPYVTLKWAETADGKIAGAAGTRLQISNEPSSRQVHALRGRVDVIVVGIKTVLRDDPLLTTRDAPSLRVSTRVVLDSHLRLPLTSKLVLSAAEQPVKVFCHRMHSNTERAAALTAAGVMVNALRMIDLSKHDGDQRMSLTEMLTDFSQDSHLLVEPGPTLARAFFEQNLADRLWIIRSATELNDPSAPRAVVPSAQWLPVGALSLAGDTLTEYLNTASPAFFAAVPSADFILAQEAAASS